MNKNLFHLSFTSWYFTVLIFENIIIYSTISNINNNKIIIIKLILTIIIIQNEAPNYNYFVMQLY